MSPFRFGALVGGLVGYVLGAKAGRQRYEQLAGWARSASQTRPAQQLSAEVRGIADRAGEAISEKATESVARVSSMVRGGNRSSGNGAGAESAEGHRAP